MNRTDLEDTGITDENTKRLGGGAPGNEVALSHDGSQRGKLGREMSRIHAFRSHNSVNGVREISRVETPAGDTKASELGNAGNSTARLADDEWGSGRIPPR